MFKFKDVNQRESLSGFALRNSDSLSGFVKRLRRAFENHLQGTLVKFVDNYSGIRVLAFNSNEHRQKQLSLCQQNKMVKHQQGQPLPNDVNFFLDFFKIICSLFLVALLILVKEIFFKCFTEQMAKFVTNRKMPRRRLTRRFEYY